MTTSQEARGTTTLVAPEQARGLLTEAQRKALPPPQRREEAAAPDAPAGPTRSYPPLEPRS